AVRIGGYSIGQDLWRLARVRSQRKSRAFAARRPWTERADRHGIDRPEIVVRRKLARFLGVGHRIGKSGAGEDRSRDLPSLQQRIRPVPSQRGLYRDLPDVVRVEGVAHIVLRRSIAATKIVRVLRAQWNAGREKHQTTV